MNEQWVDHTRLCVDISQAIHETFISKHSSGCTKEHGLDDPNSIGWTTSSGWTTGTP